MSRYSVLSPWVKKSVLLANTFASALMFCGYYFLWGVLCFLITAPDQVLAVNAFKSSSIVETIASWGFCAGFLLSFIGLSSGLIGFSEFFKQRDWMKVIKRLVTLVLSASVLLAPVFVLKNNIVIRQTCSFEMLSTFIVFFLVVVSVALCRPSTVTREIQHAA